MDSFVNFVLYELKDILILVILAGAFAAVVIGITYLVFKKKRTGTQKFPWRKILLSLLLAGYLFILLSATILRKQSGFRGEYNLHLFRAWWEAWNNFSTKNWANVLLNVALFAPLGSLLPLLWRRCRKWYITIPIGFAVSLMIELVQLAINRGICDVDDLFANTLGTALGFFCIMAVLSLFHEKGHKLKPCLLYSGIALIPILAISGIFLSYHIKEFGNLPQAAAYTNNTKDIEWILECELPEIGTQVPVYRNQIRSTADCDAFAEDFKQVIHTEYQTITYYQEAAYYMDHGSDGGAHFLHVNYLDQGYEYSAHFDDDAAWIVADRAAVEGALSIYPVHIPETAQFIAEGEGWHSFTARQHIDGAMLFDGTLRVRLAEGGSVREIKNQLLGYTYYDQVNTLTPKEALDRLKAGQFNDEGYLEYVHPSAVCIQECTLEYRVDTKGFYQPVYIFDLEATDGSYQYNVMVPAMK